jgi:mevalonate pyrophosphate decarboxylase
MPFDEIAEMARRMTGSQSRSLSVGARVCWRDDKNDQATVTQTNWSGVTLKWDNRSHQSVLHNDMECVGIVSKK